MSKNKINSYKNMFERWNNEPYQNLIQKFISTEDNNKRLCLIHFGKLTKEVKKLFEQADSIRLHLGVGYYRPTGKSDSIFELCPPSTDTPKSAVEMLSLAFEVKCHDNDKFTNLKEPFILPNRWVHLDARFANTTQGKHLGVSNGYKRAAFSNWTAIDKGMIPNLFYIDAPGPGVHYDKNNHRSTLAMDQSFLPPIKIRSFVLPGTDISALQKRIRNGDKSNDDHLFVIMGATYGHYVLHSFNITPIIGFGTLGKGHSTGTNNHIPLVSNSDLLLDVLTPCPPDCDVELINSI